VLASCSASLCYSGLICAGGEVLFAYVLNSCAGGAAQAHPSTANCKCAWRSLAGGTPTVLSLTAAHGVPAA
jgi:hypothetical protein